LDEKQVGRDNFLLNYPSNKILKTLLFRYESISLSLPPPSMDLSEMRASDDGKVYSGIHADDLDL
jgi:hypothetical protein